MRVFTRIRQWYPLTFLGTIHIIVTSYMWVYSFLNAIRPISIVSSAMFLFLFCTLFLTYRSKTMLSSSSFSWSFDSHGIVLSSDRDTLPFLLRSVLEWRATLRCTKKITHRSMLSFSFPLNSQGLSRLPIPLCGMLDIECTKVIQDIFGLTRAVLQKSETSTVPCIPLLPLNEMFYLSHTDSDKENQTIQSAAESEKIFIREYVPGDLSRDINWKAASRTGSLITKIPPQSPQNVYCVTIALFLPIIFDQKDNAKPSCVALSCICSLTYSLMHQIRESLPNATIKIKCEDLEYILLSDKDIEHVTSFLCELSFSHVFTQRDPDPDCTASWVIGSVQNPFFIQKIESYSANGSRVIPIQKKGYTKQKSTSDFLFSLTKTLPFFIPDFAMFQEFLPSKNSHTMDNYYLYEVTL